MYCTSQFIGMMGKVHYIDDNGDLLVYFRNSMFHINPAAVTKVKEIPTICSLLYEVNTIIHAVCQVWSTTYLVCQ